MRRKPTFYHDAQAAHKKFLAKIQLHIIDQRATLDMPLLHDAKVTVGHALSDPRDIAKSLNSNRIQQSRLFESVREELQRIQRSGIMQTFAELQGKEVPIADQKKLVIFRAIQEALQNILKHSLARQITVAFVYQPTQLVIGILDDGRGFDTAALGTRDGQGLQNNITRTHMTGGTAAINSTLGTGTNITLTTTYE